MTFRARYIHSHAGSFYIHVDDNLAWSGCGSLLPHSVASLPFLSPLIHYPPLFLTFLPSLPSSLTPSLPLSSSKAESVYSREMEESKQHTARSLRSSLSSTHGHGV